MISRWNETEAANFKNDPVALRAYTSRLLGQEPSLVQHGGGNTSVKVTRQNLFGEAEEILYVKGSGWDLATIQPQGFAPVRMDLLKRMAGLESLSDTDMVREQKAAMINPSAPTPSVEAILHAIIPFKYVEHTHSDAVVTMTNCPNGEALAKEVFGKKVLLAPYVMPGFVLARQIYTLTQDVRWDELEGLVLLHHGIFTFHNDAKVAYENMIRLVSLAEDAVKKKTQLQVRNKKQAQKVKPTDIATLRKKLSLAYGSPVLTRLNSSDEAVGFASWEDAARVSRKGTVTPDHVIHIKPWPMAIQTKSIDYTKNESVEEGLQKSLDGFASDYSAYFARHSKNIAGLKELDRCPRWVIWPEVGCVSVGASAKSIRIVEDITKHSHACLQWGEALGGWQPVTEAELFEVEYWELEQAKLKVIGGSKPQLQGKIAVVTGAASGIGRAIAEDLKAQGAAVAALDIDAKITELYKGDQTLGVVCDVTSQRSIDEALASVVSYFGGIDILVSNAGTFPPGQSIADLSEEMWTKTLDVNLSGHFRVIKAAIPMLKLGFDPSIVIVGSKNVPAPGPGASAYSTSKAGLTQLARVAALELAQFGVRVNTVHPDAVFDTGIWSEDVIANRAKHYGLSVEQYKTKNLLRTEITSKNVAQLVTAMTGPAFAKTTGAQVPIDGGNDRVI